MCQQDKQGQLRISVRQHCLNRSCLQWLHTYDEIAGFRAEIAKVDGAVIGERDLASGCRQNGWSGPPLCPISPATRKKLI